MDCCFLDEDFVSPFDSLTTIILDKLYHVVFLRCQAIIGPNANLQRLLLNYRTFSSFARARLEDWRFDGNLTKQKNNYVIEIATIVQVIVNGRANGALTYHSAGGPS